ncbi:MAG: alcohol dehydrogenase [Glaciihabitans sp.]|nr:alcohol dehydrogenase [Glaciihabitans sp.]
MTDAATGPSPVTTNNTGRIVLVAGATGSAGTATVAALRASGATVVAVGSNAQRLGDVAADASYVCDLTDFAAVTELAARVRSEVGPVDGLIHVVGGWRGGQSDSDWQFLESRILTTLRSTSIAFRDDLTASPAGRLAIVSSPAAESPTWSNANYATAKAAAEAWVAALASGWAKAGTAAAVTYVVRSIGDGDGETPAGVLAGCMVDLWGAPAHELNGSRVVVA